MFSQPFACEHRVWPPPNRRWWIAMTWYDLAFLHWPVAAEALRPHIPPGLTVDTRDGTAWLGLVPFGMIVRPRWLPAVPWISEALEFNVRTYVTRDGKPGVWFFSLDADHWLAVRGARWAYYLPYFDARMSLIAGQDGWIEYRTARTHRGAPPAAFHGRYRPGGPVFSPEHGTLEHWLTERHCLYTASRSGRLYRGEIHHPPWPLQEAEVEIAQTTMSDPLGLPLRSGPARVHYARRLDTVAWNLDRIGKTPVACSATLSPEGATDCDDA